MGLTDGGKARRAGQLYLAYMRGWYAAAGIHSYGVSDFEKTPDLKAEYELGWHDGKAAARAAQKAASERLGHGIVVLRATDAQGPG